MNGNEQERNIEVLLQMDGILAKGYGMVSKFPMRDTALKIKDKAIYAYLCALCGGGIKTWPSRGKIMADLQIGKTAFYNSMDRLVQEGYLTKTSRRIHGKRGMWTRTVYTIELNPKRYQDSQTEKQENLFNTLEVEGMLSDGWGFAPRLVMQDPRISIREKALYVYLLTYAAAGRVAYPDVPTITYHLGISEDTYRKLMNSLYKLGYILRHRKRKSNGQMGGYDYFICRKPSTLYEGAEVPLFPEKPEEKQDVPSNNGAYTNSNQSDLDEVPATPFKQDTVNETTPSKRDTVNETTPSKQDTVNETTPFKRDTVNQPHPLKPDTVKPDTVKPDTANPDTVNEVVRKLQVASNTSFSITSDENHNPSTTTSSDGGTDGQTADLKERIKKAGGIPTDILNDKAKVIEALKLLGDWDWKSGKIHYYDENMQNAFQLVMDTLVTLCTRKTSRISNLTLTREQIVEKLNRCCEHDRYGTFLSDFIQHATGNYVTAIENRSESGKSPVREPASYAACVIWSATDSYLHERWMLEQEEKYFY